MQFTYYGHSCFSIKLADYTILFDPFFSEEASKQIDINTIQADYIFISHGHLDHIAHATTIAQKTQATIVSSPEIVQYFQQQGINHTIDFNMGGFINFPFGQVKAVNAIHTSSLSNDSYGGTAMGFIFKTEEGNFYYAGDTALTIDMQLIPLFSTIQWAILPIGGHYTMDYKDAIIASNFIGCNHIIGVHYDTFPPIKIDKQQVVHAFTTAHKTLHLPTIGESIML